MIPLPVGSLLLVAALAFGAPPSKPCDLFRHGKFDEGVDEKQAAITGKKNGLRTFRQGVSQWENYRDTGLKLRYRVHWRDDWHLSALRPPGKGRGSGSRVGAE